MSLDVYLELTGASVERTGSGIFIRENGSTREISRQEWDERFTGEPVVAIQGGESHEVYSANITHNLAAMASEAGIYEHLWRPDEIGITHAYQLIGPLKDGVALMKADPERFKRHDPPNKWGCYEGFVPWIEGYLKACERFPSAEVRVSR